MLKPTVVSTKKQLVLSRKDMKQLLGDQGVNLPDNFIFSAYDGAEQVIIDRVEIIYDEVPN